MDIIDSKIVLLTISFIIFVNYIISAMNFNIILKKIML